MAEPDIRPQSRDAVSANEEPNPWHTRLPAVVHGSDQFPELLDAARLVQHSLSAANPPAEVVLDAARKLREVAALLDRYEVPEYEAPYGRRHDLPGRGHLFLPPVIVDEYTSEFVRGRVTFTRDYRGGSGATHGGALPLVFDEVLGQLVNNVGKPDARTAYLHVNFRQITPMNKELNIDAELDRREGRKLYASARLLDGASLIADAEGLFVVRADGS